MKRDLFLLRSIAVCKLIRDNSHLSSYLPKAFWPVFAFMTVFIGLSFTAGAADTIRVNIPRVTVTMARSYNFSSAANSVYVPVEFNSAMSADKVADYIEESNAFLFDHYGDDVVEISGVSDDLGTIYLDIKPNTGIKRVLLITSTGSGNTSYIERAFHYDRKGRVMQVVERNGYYPLGMRTSTDNSYPQLTTNLYKYNGKEVQTVGGLGFTDYGARMYDDFTGWWFVPDPLAEETVWSSPFSFNQNNPINRIDLTGRKDNPVYDTYGNFFGTNDLGLQGDAIIMDESDFEQGMSLEESMSKHKGYNSFVSEDAKNKFLEHYGNLPNRPDYDGYLTLNEANKWYREGNGQPLFVSFEKIDMSGVYSKGDKAIGKEWKVNLSFRSASTNDVLVYGQIKIKQYPNDYVIAYADWYDFDMHSFWNPFNWPRNLATIIGGILAGNGVRYEINIYGSKKLQTWYNSCPRLSHRYDEF